MMNDRRQKTVRRTSILILLTTIAAASLGAAPLSADPSSIRPVAGSTKQTIQDAAGKALAESQTAVAIAC